MSDGVIRVGDYARETASGLLCLVIGGLRRVEHDLCYMVQFLDRGSVVEANVDGLSLQKVLDPEDLRACWRQAKEIDVRRTAEAVEAAIRRAGEAARAKRKAVLDVGAENKRIWATFFPEPSDLAKGVKPAASQELDDEDWRPTFLRERPKEISDDVGHAQTVWLPDSVFVCQVTRPIRCCDELDDEALDRPWFLASDEPLEPSKVTDGLLAAWHRRIP
jgi:hypothetical protein